MAARRRANVHEIECLAGQQIVESVVPAPVGRGCEKCLAPRCDDVRSRDDRDIVARLPSGQVSADGNVAEADEGASQHASLHQSSPKRLEIAAKDWSRISTPRNASSSVMIKGGVMRITCA